MEKTVSSSTATLEAALWCLVGRQGVLALSAPMASIDRAAFTLPRFDASDPAKLRANAEAAALAGGVDATRLALVDLGETLCQQRPMRLFALLACASLAGLAASAVAQTPVPTSSGYALAPLTAQPGAPMADALIWAGAHLHFSSPRSSGRPRDYEVLASLGAHLVAEERLNEWFSDASRVFGALGLALEFDLNDPERPAIRLSGRVAALPAEIASAREQLLALGRHARGRFWVTEILSGHESVLDYAEPSTQAAVMAQFEGGHSLLTA